MSPRFGLIAGNGKFPFLVVEGAKKAGANLSVIAIKEETDKRIDEVAGNVLWVGIGQLGKMISFFEKEGVSKVIMAGQVKHVQIFSGALPDLRMMKMLFGLKQRNTDALIGGVADEMAKDGIELIDSTYFIQDQLAQEGVLTKRQPTDVELENVEYGLKVAGEIARLDLGQTIVVRAKACVAVEAMEGTDATIERAGQNGFGALGFQFVSADAAHAWVHAYYNAITKRLKKLADYEINPNIALVSFFMCAKTDEEARARADGATFFQFALRYYGASQNRQRPDPGTVNMWDEYNKWKRENPEAQEAALRGGLIGSPETIAKKLRRFRTSHIDQVILLNQAGKNSHEHICDSLELFAKEVMPEFREDPEHDAWKQGVMNGAIQIEEIDTEAFRDRYGKLAVNVAPTAKVAAG